jgi:Lrp/AsnC family transcriptional regulator, leucine-responsive regulatory protein
LTKLRRTAGSRFPRTEIVRQGEAVAGLGTEKLGAEMAELDDIDRKLLHILQGDGRTPYAELGKAVGLAVSSVNERVRKLGERGVITGVHTHVSPVALDLDLLAVVFVGWSDPGVEEPFLARIADEPAVLECHHVTGTWNYLLKVRVRGTRMLEAFLGKVIKSIDGIQRTESLIVLSSPKETSALATETPDWAR